MSLHYGPFIFRQYPCKTGKRVVHQEIQYTCSTFSKDTPWTMAEIIQITVTQTPFTPWISQQMNIYCARNKSGVQLHNTSNAMIFVEGFQDINELARFVCVCTNTVSGLSIGKNIFTHSIKLLCITLSKQMLLELSMSISSEQFTNFYKLL